MSEAQFFFLLSTSAFVLGIALLRYFLARVQRKEQLLAQGQKAEARVLQVIYTGNYSDENPEIRLEAEVTPASEPPFRATFTAFVSHVIAHDVVYVPGAIIPVRFNMTGAKPKVMLHQDARGYLEVESFAVGGLGFLLYVLAVFFVVFLAASLLIHFFT